ncbi:EAL domain-containing protein [Marinobacter hydrocarbonoclasticus]|nr:EAL domain-containing protein [Marinobacter nauticus]
MNDERWPNILIINDDPFQQNTISKRLINHGILSCICINAVDNINSVDQSKSYICILDVDLGLHGNSYENYHQLLTSGAIHSVIIHSAYPEDIRQSVHNLLISAGISSVRSISKSEPFSRLLDEIGALSDSGLNSGANEVDSMLKTQFEELEIKPFYQAQAIPDSGAIQSLEVLGRLVDRRGTIINPSEFIDYFVDTGQISEYTFDLINRTLTEVLHTFGRPVPLSFNIDYASLEEPDFSSQLLNTIKQQRYPISLITLELTESGFSRSDYTYQNLIRLRLAGARLSIDDFDMTQATVDELLEFPFGEIKFDKAMVKRAHSDAKLFELMLSISQMCKRMDIAVLVEGVETKRDEALALKLSADKVQGFFYQKPESIEMASRIKSQLIKR